MSYDMRELDAKMRRYFENCVTVAQTKGLPRSQKEIATIAGLCKELGLRKSALMDFEHGTEEETLFFEDMLLEYEIAVDAMKTASLLSDAEYKDLKKTVFSRSDGSNDTRINLVFPNWNAPDEWEELMSLKAKLDAEREAEAEQRAKEIASGQKEPGTKT